MKKYYYAKEVTCKDCEGVGYRYREDNVYYEPCFSLEEIENRIDLAKTDEEAKEWEEALEYYYEDYFCYTCNGKGYIEDLVDKETGYTVIEVPFEEIKEPKVEGNVNHISYLTVNDIIAEHYGIIDYESFGSEYTTTFVFRTKNHDYWYKIVPYNLYNPEVDKLLIPKPIIYKNVVSYVVTSGVKQRKVCD